LYVKAATPSFKTSNPSLEKKDLTALIKTAWKALENKEEWEKEHTALLSAWKTKNEVFMKKNPGWKSPSKGKGEKKVESGSLELEFVEAGGNGGGDQVVA
jgi:hypothetical protein